MNNTYGYAMNSNNIYVYNIHNNTNLSLIRSNTSVKHNTRDYSSTNFNFTMYCANSYIQLNIHLILNC